MTNVPHKPAPLQPDVFRLRRALHLDCVRVEDQSWLVSGTGATHIVSPSAASCDCADFAARGVLCKHRLRCLIAEGDAATWGALRALVTMPTRQRRQATS